MQETKNYILDLYNGEIIAFSMSKRPTLDFVMGSLKQALLIIHERVEYRTTIHSDQGWHYQHHSWVKTIKQNKVFQSMSRKGNCLDNAVFENFFGLLKSELLYIQEFESIVHFKRELELYIEYYNHKRIKGKLKGLSPIQYRIQSAA
ncbi:IS3 family transposase [Lysinibacillus cavernae]|uniref:IS3 family transposase n=1 Tax=Lysinibacillus cavernae TaxID=2666135 RepID=UPI0012D8E9F4|nr:IS3 family transposase [Lysinibacillus cavernae]